MSRSPQLIVECKAVAELLAKRDVRIRRADENVVEFAAAMPPNTVNVSCLTFDVVVTTTGLDWTRDAITSVRYPASHDDRNFKTKLSKVLRPVVDDHLARLAVAEVDDINK